MESELKWKMGNWLSRRGSNAKWSAGNDFTVVLCSANQIDDCTKNAEAPGVERRPFIAFVIDLTFFSSVLAIFVAKFVR
jgi:hypothetical protein